MGFSMSFESFSGAASCHYLMHSVSARGRAPGATRALQGLSWKAEDPKAHKALGRHGSQSLTSTGRSRQSNRES